jgi:hypothetical protein
MQLLFTCRGIHETHRLQALATESLTRRHWQVLNTIGVLERTAKNLERE